MTDDLTPSQESAVRNAMNAARLRAEVARLTAEVARERGTVDFLLNQKRDLFARVERAEAQVTAVRAYANHQHNVVGALISGPDVIAVMNEAKVGGS
jgi:hypothetical protein